MAQRQFAHLNPVWRKALINPFHPIETLTLNLRSGLLSLVLGFGFWVPVNAQNAVSACGALNNTFGPFDYRDHAGSDDFKKNPNNPLYLVESAHFRPEMEALIRGGQGPRSAVGPELDYTLRAFPNHHKALDAMVRLSEKLKIDPVARYTVHCWFERAIAFRPDDNIARMIFAAYLGKQKRVPDALKHLEAVAATTKENAFTHYNLGLIYLELGEIPQALAQAHIAYGLGMQRTELREKLTSAGHWRDPLVATPSQPASGPSKSQ